MAIAERGFTVRLQVALTFLGKARNTRPLLSCPCCHQRAPRAGQP